MLSFLEKLKSVRHCLFKLYKFIYINPQTRERLYIYMYINTVTDFKFFDNLYIYTYIDHKM